MRRWLQRVKTARAGAFDRRVTTGLALLLIALSVIGLDQLTKYLIRANMDIEQSIPRDCVVGLHYTTNTGGAFGLFANQVFLLTMTAVIGIAVIVLYLRYLTPRSMLLNVALGLDLGGAIGNLIDRLRLGEVTDFIKLGAWPVFNIADSAIVVGTFLIAFGLLFAARRRAVSESDARLTSIAEMNKRLEFTVISPSGRLDRYVAEQCQVSRAYAQRLIDEGQITVNGHRSKASHRLAAGDRVVATIPPPSPVSLAPEDIPLKVVYEDSDLIVVDKPAGLLVHPAAGQSTGTLVNALLARCPGLQGIDGSVRPGIVHRLDKNTSGLMVVAKNDAAQMSLSRQIKQRSITKGYLALVTGRLSPERGAIEAPIGRHPKERKRMSVLSEGREARTQYQVIKYLNGYTLLEAMPETGRTHQIRVHLSAIGHPIFGDPVYGKRSPLLGRQFLHAHHLGFRLPSTGEFVEFRSELPPELNEVLERLTTQDTG